MTEAPASSFLSVALEATKSAKPHTHIIVWAFYWQLNCPSSHCYTPFGPMASGAICASILCSLAPGRLWVGYMGLSKTKGGQTYYFLNMIDKVHKNKRRADWSCVEASPFFRIQLTNLVKMLQEPRRRCNVQLVRDIDVHPHCMAPFLFWFR